jgi:hypothetical protein
MRRGITRAGARSVSDLLCLAATPTFLIMALAAGMGPDMICSAMGTPMSGMTAMYLLMGLFHAGPWLKLISNPFTLAKRRFES